MRTRVSLCDRCRNRDSENMRFLRQVFLDSGLEGPRSIWCSAKDRPEDERWERCAGFDPYGEEAAL